LGTGILICSTFLTVCSGTRLKLTSNRVESVSVSCSGDSLAEIVSNVDEAGNYALGAGILVGSAFLTVRSSARLKLTSNRVESVSISRSGYGLTEIVSDVDVVWKYLCTQCRYSCLQRISDSWEQCKAQTCL
jgi:hypothetical protein